MNVTPRRIVPNSSVSQRTLTQRFDPPRDVPLRNASISFVQRRRYVSRLDAPPRGASHVSESRRNASHRFAPPRAERNRAVAPRSATCRFVPQLSASRRLPFRHRPVTRRMVTVVIYFTGLTLRALPAVSAATQHQHFCGHPQRVVSHRNATRRHAQRRFASTRSAALRNAPLGKSISTFKRADPACRRVAIRHAAHRNYFIASKGNNHASCKNPNSKCSRFPLFVESPTRYAAPRSRGSRRL